MALIQCPHCGQPVSDSATQCPHCSNQIVTVFQRNKSSRYSLTAMWVCIAGVILRVPSIIYGIYAYNKSISLSAESYKQWMIDNFVLDNIIGVVSIFSSILIILSWLIWFIRGNRRTTSIKVAIILCVVAIGIRVLKLIPNYGWYRFFDYNIETYNIFISIISISAYLLSVAIGITLLLIRNTGKIRVLKNWAGVLFILCYIISIALPILSIPTMPHFILNEMPYSLLLSEVPYIGLLIISIIIFHNTYKEAKE